MGYIPLNPLQLASQQLRNVPKSRQGATFHERQAAILLSCREALAQAQECFPFLTCGERSLENDPPARDPPMKIRLKQGAKPNKCRVRKGATGDYRQTEDYKPLNAQVEAVDETCQEMLSYMTHRKIYTPRRAPQGCCYAAVFFQATIEMCLTELMYKHMLVLTDDLQLLSADVKTYLVKLERLVELLEFFGFKLSVQKSSLFEPQVKWCGKIITGQRVSYDPELIKALTNLSYPTNAAELQQFL
ncbi:unnamed protein product [Phytophthora fragariaefolia]|uniref:Unnamed protein product n=1 Tax=Phytophthora fragariaefolia TaxID=1490495 RepID=A0A9W6Y7U2_9STRA|nr:unnamed protein product [Phytophthora fragariaefolia]